MMRPGPRRHHQHLVGEIHRLGQAVGDEHHGLGGLRPDAQQLVPHGHARLLVERGERLVHQQHGRVLHQAARDGDALLHAARQLVRVAAAEALQADQIEHGVGALAALLARRAADAERELDVVERRQPGKQAGLLEHHADAVGIGLGDGPAGAQDGARRLVPEPRHHHQQRGLAAAAGPDDHDEAAGADGERDVLQRRHLALAALVDVRQPCHLDGGRPGLRAQLLHVRQVLHRVSSQRTVSLKAMATVASRITPANSCGIWKFSPQLAIM